MNKEEFMNHIARDCIHFKANQPCLGHQKKGYTCRCPIYAPTSSKQLIIELSSPIRAIHISALAYRLKMDNPNGRLICLTAWPEWTSSDGDEVLSLDAASIARLQMDTFECVYNLDMDRRACAVMNLVNAERKKGFYLRDGQPYPIDSDATAAYIQTTFPQTSTPPQGLRGLFQLCGLDYRHEVPHLKGTSPAADKNSIDEGPVVGLAVSSGNTPPNTPGWPQEHWIQLVRLLMHNNCIPILIGDQSNHTMNRNMAESCKASYPGPLTMKAYPGLIDRCSIVIGPAGLATEIAMAMGKRAVVLTEQRTTMNALKEVYHDRCCIIGSEALPAEPIRLESLLPDQLCDTILKQIQTQIQNKTSPSDRQLSQTEIIAFQH